MRVKIHGGTLSSQNLCHRCVYGLVRNRGLSSESINCQVTDERLRGPVYQCSDFSRRDTVSLKKMEEAAWIIETSRPRRVGFSQEAPPLVVKIRAPKEEEE